MNQLTQELKAKMIPKAALVAYALDDDSHSRTNNYFVEMRPIGGDGTMGAAIPVSFDFMNALAAGFTENYSDICYGLLPETMLYADTRVGREKYIWYNPPGRRMMYFGRNLAIDDDEYNVPGVVYVVTKDSMNIYAFKGKRPTPDSELFNAPFFNVTGSSVCLGSAKIEKPAKPTYIEVIEYWEKRFWLTEFTHLGGGTNPTKHNLVLVTKAAQDAGFSYDELKKANRKLKDILK